MSVTIENEKEYTEQELKAFHDKRVKNLRQQLEVLKLQDEVSRLTRRIAENKAKEGMWIIRYANMFSAPEEQMVDNENDEEESDLPIEEPKKRRPRKLKREE